MELSYCTGGCFGTIPPEYLAGEVAILID